MPKINYVGSDGTVRSFDVAVGQSVMQGAIANKVPGILAECGGACACATCQVFVDPAWVDRTGSPGPLEESMIEDSTEARPNLRLSCQIAVSDELDGLIVHVPASQR